MKRLDDDAVACLDKDNFDVDIRHSLDNYFEYFLFSHPLGYLLDGAFGLQCILHHGYMKECGWYDTYVHFY